MSEIMCKHNCVLIGLVLVLSSLLSDVLCMDNCLEHKFNHSLNTAYMQFTKEAVNREYAALEQFKSLHCCAKGYRSIEWFKDGQPYPWGKDVSSLILYTEHANQTIFTIKAKKEDFGNYTCVLRNDTHKTEHFIELKWQAGNTPDIPLATFKPVDQYVNLGEPARIYCEAFVGKIELPDVRSDISWYQMFDNQQQDVADVQKITREDGHIIGAYLTIPAMHKHNYGQYLCRVEMGNAEHRLDMYAWLYADNEEDNKPSLVLPLLLALLAAIFTVSTFYAIRCGSIWWNAKIRKNKYDNNQCAAHLHEPNDDIGV